MLDEACLGWYRDVYIAIQSVIQVNSLYKAGDMGNDVDCSRIIRDGVQCSVSETALWLEVGENKVTQVSNFL